MKTDYLKLPEKHYGVKPTVEWTDWIKKHLAKNQNASPVMGLWLRQELSSGSIVEVGVRTDEDGNLQPNSSVAHNFEKVRLDGTRTCLGFSLPAEACIALVKCYVDHHIIPNPLHNSYSVGVKTPPLP